MTRRPVLPQRRQLSAAGDRAAAAASGRPQVPVLAAGYRLVSRAVDARQPHWLAARNGPDVEARLRQCSLYRPELDLAVEAPDGRAAGYGLFWADPVTRVGLVEPVRT